MKLKRVYDHRMSIAQARVKEQLLEVEKTQLELVERKNIVAELDSQLQQNLQFLNAKGATTQAESLHAANRHRYWVDYDKQRESFYVTLTYDELHEKQVELRSRQKALAKLKAKNDLFDDLINEEMRKKNRALERQVEIEQESLTAARRKINV